MAPALPWQSCWSWIMTALVQKILVVLLNQNKRHRLIFWCFFETPNCTRDLNYHKSFQKTLSLLPWNNVWFNMEFQPWRIVNDTQLTQQWWFSCFSLIDKTQGCFSICLHVNLFKTWHERGAKLLKFCAFALFCGRQVRWRKANLWRDCWTWSCWSLVCPKKRHVELQTSRFFTLRNVPFFQSWDYMGVSRNRGTPKWMIHNGNPY